MSVHNSVKPFCHLCKLECNGTIVFCEYKETESCSMIISVILIFKSRVFFSSSILYKVLILPRMSQWDLNVKSITRSFQTTV